MLRAWWDQARELQRTQRELRRMREDLDYLRGELERLRGRMTGGIRYTGPKQLPPGDDDDYEVIEEVG